MYNSLYDLTCIIQCIIQCIGLRCVENFRFRTIIGATGINKAECTVRVSGTSGKSADRSILRVNR